MSDVEQKVEAALVAGRITADDAAELRNFAAFLEEAGPPMSDASFDRARARQALLRQYPEDAAAAE
jgi:hypothetical protein